MSDTGNMMKIGDNGGRRSGTDRRSYSYSGHIPERRCGFDRRKLENRRLYVSELRGIERRKEFN